MPAQVPPKPYFAAPVRGQVVDTDDGRALEGVAVVARWEWLDYTRRGFYNHGDVVQMSEAVTGRDGRFAIPGWGPKVRAAGKMEDGAPRLYVFKGGYEPLQRDEGGAPRGPIRLRKSNAIPKQYAAQIAEFQEGGRRGLAWRHESENWRAMPHMILAIHREKARLGEEGAAIRGANLLHGRSGKGQLVDAQTQKPLESSAAIRIVWTMRRLGAAPGTRRLVQQKYGVEGYPSTFFVSPWRLPGPELPGWEIDPDVAPTLRVYATGYKRSAELRWEEKGGIVRLEKLPETREALLGQLREWRRDIDADLHGGDREAAAVAQRPLLEMLAGQCERITPDLRPGICFERDSEVALNLAKVRRFGDYSVETWEGIRVIRAASSIAASPASAPNTTYGNAALITPRTTVGGFTIEPTP